MADLFDIANLITTVGVEAVKIKQEPGLPEKSSNEILTELFSTFDADEIASPVEDKDVECDNDDDDDKSTHGKKKKKTKKKHKHKDKKHKKRSKHNSSESDSDEDAGKCKKKQKQKHCIFCFSDIKFHQFCSLRFSFSRHVFKSLSHEKLSIQ